MLNYAMIILAAVLDVSANLLLQKSDGFKHKRYGIPALIFVCGAFSLLAQVTREIDLTVAYVSWGAFAVVGTCISARILLNQKLNWRGYLGIVAIFGSIILLKTA